jgi:hypothetical protein
MTDTDLAGVFEDHRVNAALAWVLVAVVLVDAVTEFALGELTAGVFALVVAVIAVLPAIALRNPRLMVPWEILALAALPVLGRLFAGFPVTEALATYLAVAAVALIVAVELHVFTTVRMTLGFAIVTVVVFTTAAAGAWAVLQYAAHVLLDTAFETTNDELMREFVYSILAGCLAAAVYEFYVRRRANVDRQPPEVEPR